MKTFILLALAGTFLASTAFAQELVLLTNPPLTRLEALEARSGTVLLRATAPIGTVNIRPAAVQVRYRETTDVGAGRKEHGLLITLHRTEREQDTVVIDYDELESFLSGLEYLSKADFNVTTFPSFDAGYRTRSQFRVFIYTSQNRPGTLQYALHDGRSGKPWVLLSALQLTEFKNVIAQAKGKLDELRAPP